MALSSAVAGPHLQGQEGSRSQNLSMHGTGWDKWDGWMSMIVYSYLDWWSSDLVKHPNQLRLCLVVDLRRWKDAEDAAFHLIWRFGSAKHGLGAFLVPDLLRITKKCHEASPTSSKNYDTVQKIKRYLQFHRKWWQSKGLWWVCWRWWRRGHIFAFGCLNSWPPRIRP